MAARRREPLAGSRFAQERPNLLEVKLSLPSRCREYGALRQGYEAV